MSATQFCTLLKRHRLAAGFTQEELAEQARLSVRAVSALEQGVNRAPRKDTVALLAEALALAAPARAEFEAAARGRETRSPLDDTAAMRPPLVGRARELALLERHLTERCPPVLLLAGEPGIGKSRLLREADARARTLGLSVLSGGCQRRGGQEPFAPLLEALARHLDQQTEPARHAALQGCAWLARLLPELSYELEEQLPARSLTPEQERRLIVGAVSRYLANSAGPAGALLLLDDMQWAGSDALELLAALLRARSGPPVRVIAAYRDSETPRESPLAMLAGDLAHAGLAWHRTLLTLPMDEARQLLRQQLEGSGHTDEALLERMLRRTGGLPFFVVSCAQALRQGEGGTDVVPWDLAASIRQRVAALPEHTQSLLGVAALIGRTVPRDVLAAVTERADVALVGSLEEACQARLLLEDGSSGYRFTHDVIREVAEAELSAARRALLHRRIAEVLERQQGELPVEALAYHFGLADARDQALRYLELAGDRALSRNALAAAEEHLRELCRRLSEYGRDRDMARACEKLGNVLQTAARYDEALTILERAAEVYGATGDLEMLGGVTAHIGHVYRCQPAPEAGLARIRPVLATLEAGGPSRGLAALYSTLAHLSFAAGGRYDDQLAAAIRAEQLARETGFEQLLVDTQESRGSALIMMGKVVEGMRIIEEAIPCAETLHDRETPGLLPSQEVLGLLHWRAAKVYTYRGEWSTARRHAERGREVLSRLGAASVHLGAIGASVAIAFLAGDWPGAQGLIDEETAIDSQIGPTWALPYVALDRGQLLLAEGSTDDAARRLETALAFAREHGDLQAIRRADALLAECDLLAARPARARERLAAHGDRPGMDEPDVTALLPTLARALLDLDDIEEAEVVAATAVARARETGYRVLEVDALWAHALVAIRRAAWLEAARTIAAGLTLARSMPYPYGEARLLEAAARLHRATGEHERAQNVLREALAIARRLGAKADEARLTRI